MSSNISDPVVYEHPDPVFLDADGCVTIFCEPYKLAVKARVKRAPAGGARYAMKWTRVPTKIMKMLQLWKGNAHCNSIITSSQVAEMFNFGMGMAHNPCQARLSEMVAMNLVVQHGGTKDGEHHNTRAPVYELNHLLVDMVFANGGQLTAEEEEAKP